MGDELSGLIAGYVVRHRRDSPAEPQAAWPIGFAHAEGRSYALFRCERTGRPFAICECSPDGRYRVHARRTPIVEMRGDEIVMASAGGRTVSGSMHCLEAT
jgi:hypothetical protein